MKALGTLTLLSPLTGSPAAGGKVVLTRKFVSGTELYCKLWPGPVRVARRP